MALAIDTRLKDRLVAGDHKAVIDYASLGKDSALAVPTLDHYLPMIYILRLQEQSEPLVFTHEGIQNGSVSMRAFRIG